MYVTCHAKTRIKQRCNVNKKKSKKLAKNAFEKGIRVNETTGKLNKWLTWLYYRGVELGSPPNNIRLYQGKVFLFDGVYLMTVYDIPEYLKKEDINSMITRK